MNMKMIAVFAVMALAAVHCDDTFVKCNIGFDDKGGANVTTCAANVNMCYSPVDAADNKFAGYGCGACPEDAANGTCTTCDSDDVKACNSYVTPTVNYKCYKSGKEEACPAAPEINCFMAKANYTGNDATLTAGGCGTCEAAMGKANFTAADCMDCKTNLCNSATKMATLLAPLLAVLFWLH